MAIAMYFITVIVRRIARSVLQVEVWTPTETRCYQNVSLMEAVAEYMPGTPACVSHSYDIKIKLIAIECAELTTKVVANTIILF